MPRKSTVFPPQAVEKRGSRQEEKAKGKGQKAKVGNESAMRGTPYLIPATSSELPRSFGAALVRAKDTSQQALDAGDDAESRNRGAPCIAARPGVACGACEQDSVLCRGSQRFSRRRRWRRGEVGSRQEEKAKGKRQRAKGKSGKWERDGSGSPAGAVGSRKEEKAKGKRQRAKGKGRGPFRTSRNLL